jgi:succinoglycan biosynthesis protein ExoA
MTLVSILVPAYQERAFIRSCLGSVLAFELPAGVDTEILVLDGMSTDGTREVVAEVAKQEPRVRLIDNPWRIQSTALNIGIRLSAGDYIVRIDAHSTYPRDYLSKCLETAQRTGADNVGGVVDARTRDDGYQAALVQAMTTHKFGVGNSGFRTDAGEGPADTVAFGCFRRDVFTRLGLFDERLVRGQDYEFNRRILRGAGTVWLNPAIRATYYNQPHLIPFLRKQVSREAPYNAYLWYVAPYAFAARHAITALFAVGVLGGLALAPLASSIAWLFGIAMALYGALALGAATQQALRFRHWRHVLALPFCFFAYHFLHGLGVLHGLVLLVTGTAPVQQVAEPWPGAGRARAWPPVGAFGSA